MSPAKVSFAEYVDGRERGTSAHANIADQTRAKQQRLAPIQSEVVEPAVKAEVVLEAQQRCLASMVPRAIRAYEAFQHIQFVRASEA